MRKVELTTEERVRHKPRYQWFIALALVLLALEILIGERGPAVKHPPQRVWQREAT